MENVLFSFHSYWGKTLQMLVRFFHVIAVDWAADWAYNAIFANHGQNCCAGSRTFVHEGIYDKFVEKARELAVARKVGDPYKSDTDQGPQVNMFVDL